MDGSIIIIILLVSYAIYEAVWKEDPLKARNLPIDYSKVPPKYYKKYRRYLRSAEWKELREFRAMLDDNKCTICGSTHHLHCHHIHYEGIETMDFYISQLTTVCESCHKKIHHK